MNIETYYPELQQVKPSNKFEAQFMGTKYRVKTFETLKGQGIKFAYKVENMPGIKPERVGLNVYDLTIAAFTKLRNERRTKLNANNKITLEILLD
jgi:hypothetical protein